MIFGVAIHTIFFYTCFVLLGAAVIFFKLDFDFVKKCIAVILSVLLSFILSLSRLIPIFILSSKIDRGSLMVDNVPFYKVFEVIYYNFLLSVVSFIEKLFSLNLFFDIQYRGIWEKDLSIPFMVFPIMIAIIIINRKDIKEYIINLSNFDKLKIILFIICFYLVFDIYYDNGMINSLFPFLKKMNLRLRICSVLILPFSIFLSYLLNNYRLFDRRKFAVIMILLNIYTLFFFVYKHADNFYYGEPFRNVDLKIGIEVWNKINDLGSNNNYKITEISEESEGKILEQFLSNDYNLYSSRFPYEPIYGYSLETFKSKEEGSIYKVSNNYYNFTHPNSLIFFDDNHKQFTGFSLEQKDDLEKFASFKKADWKLPKIFYIANDVSFYSYIIVICLFSIAIIMNIVILFAGKIIKL